MASSKPRTSPGLWEPQKQLLGHPPPRHLCVKALPLEQIPLCWYLWVHDTQSIRGVLSELRLLHGTPICPLSTLCPSCLHLTSGTSGDTGSEESEVSSPCTWSLQPLPQSSIYSMLPMSSCTPSAACPTPGLEPEVTPTAAAGSPQVRVGFSGHRRRWI